MNVGGSKWKNKSLLKRKPAATKILCQTKSMLLGHWKKLPSFCSTDYLEVELMERWLSFPAWHSSCGQWLELTQPLSDLSWPGTVAGEKGIVKFSKAQGEQKKTTSPNSTAQHGCPEQQQWKAVVKFTVEKFWTAKCSFMIANQRSAPCHPLDSQKKSSAHICFWFLKGSPIPPWWTWCKTHKFNFLGLLSES